MAKNEDLGFVEETGVQSQDTGLGFIPEPAKVDIQPAPELEVEAALNEEKRQIEQGKFDRLKAAQDEQEFQSFYSDIAKRNKLDPNPDDPRHFYDYRAYFEAVKTGQAPLPQFKPEHNQYRMPDEFKLPGHPDYYTNTDPQTWTVEQTQRFIKEHPAQNPEEEAQREAFLDQKKMLVGQLKMKFTDYDKYIQGQMNRQIADGKEYPHEELLKDPEKMSAFESFTVPYVKGTAGFFTRLGGVEPFGSTYSSEEIKQSEKDHPIASAVGKAYGGIGPIALAVAAAPETLMGQLFAFSGLGALGQAGIEKTQGNLMDKEGSRDRIIKSTLKSAAYAPLWYYTQGLTLGGPVLSIMARAGSRGTGAAGIEKVGGASTQEAVMSGLMTAGLSGLFELTPYTANKINTTVKNSAIDDMAYTLSRNDNTLKNTMVRNYTAKYGVSPTEEELAQLLGAGIKIEVVKNNIPTAQIVKTAGKLKEQFKPKVAEVSLNGEKGQVLLPFNEGDIVNIAGTVGKIAKIAGDNALITTTIGKQIQAALKDIQPTGLIPQGLPETSLSKVPEHKKEYVKDLFKIENPAVVDEFISNDPEYHRAIERNKLLGEKTYIQSDDPEEQPNYYQPYLEKTIGKNVPSAEGQPEVILWMGLPGSGKTQMAKSLGLDKTHIQIDPDDAKKFIPETRNDPALSDYVHKESAYMADELLMAKAIEQNKNIIWPLVGKNPKKVQDVIDRFKEAGYKVELNYNKLSSIEAKKRVYKRFLEDKRLTSTEYIDKIGDQTLDQNFERLKGMADKYTSWDVNTKIGEPPKKLEEGVNYEEPAVTAGVRERAGSGGYPVRASGESVGTSKEQGIPVETTGEGKVNQSLWHETGSYGLDSLMAYSDASGLNVSTDKSLALGQGGKGILVELSKDVLLGDRGSLRAIKKPGMEIVGQKEFELVGGSNKPGTIKSITIKTGVPITQVQKAILNRDYNKVINEDKSITFTPKLSTITKQKITGVVKEGQSEYYKKDIFSKDPSSGSEYKSPLLAKWNKSGSMVFAKETISSPADVAFAFKQLKNAAVEHLYCVGIKKNKPVCVELITIGGLDSAYPETFELVGLLVNKKADGFYVIHNHPSGNIEYSPEDMGLSKSLSAAVGKLGIKFSGHVIIDDTKFGFINNEFEFDQYLHHPSTQEGKKVAIYQKYNEWIKSVDDFTAQPSIKGPAGVFELIKGITKDLDQGDAVIFMNPKNQILSVETVPSVYSKSADIVKKAAAGRSKTIIVVTASGYDQVKHKVLETELEEVNIKLLDSIGVDLKTGKFEAYGYKGVINTPGLGVSELGEQYNNIPEFKSTEGALDWGLKNKDNPEAISALTLARDKVLSEIEVLKSIPSPTDAQIQLRFDKAVQAQFYNEALETAQQTDIPPQEITSEEVPSVIDQAYKEMTPEDQARFELEMDDLRKTAEGNLFVAIRQLGGIAPYTSTGAKAGTKFLAEELASVPASLKNKNSQHTLDTILDNLESLGWHFSSSDELLEEIKRQAANPVEKVDRASLQQIIRDAQKNKKLQQEILDKVLPGKRRKFITTVKNAQKTAEEVRKTVESRYEPISNAKTLKEAQDFVVENMEEAVSLVEGPGRTNTFTNAVGIVLIDKAQAEGRFTDAIRMVERLAEKNTELGQAIQALAMYERLTPEGVLQYAQKQVRKAREDVKQKERLTNFDKLAKGLGSKEQDDLAKKLGVPHISGILADELRKMAQNLQRLPSALDWPDFLNMPPKNAYQYAMDLFKKLEDSGQMDPDIKNAFQQVFDGFKKAGIGPDTDQNIPWNQEMQGAFNKSSTAPDIGQNIPWTKELQDTFKIGMGKLSRARQIEEALLLKKIAGIVPPSLGKKLAMVQTLAQLLNPKTFVRNILGNIGFQAAENISDTFGALLDIGVSLRTGKRSVYVPNIGTQGKGLVQGMKEGTEEALLGINLKPGQMSKYTLPSNGVFDKGVLGALEKTLRISLSATDRAFYQAAFNQSIREQCAAAGLDDPTEEMIEKANQMGLYRTFQDDNVISNFFSGLKKLLNLGKDFGLGDIVIKYPKTPANILARGIEYSPFGFVKTVFILSRPLFQQGPFDQEDFVRSTSRAFTGSALLVGVGAILAALGIISGKRAKDKDVAATREKVGIREYQINASALKRFVASGLDPEQAKLREEDNLYTYDWFLPGSIGLALGADMVINPKENIVDKTMNLGDRLLSASETLQEQPLVQGLRVLTSKENLAEGLADVVQGIPASFVPTVLNQVRQLSDNTARNTKDPNYFKEAYNKAIMRVPGLSSTLPAKVDTLGNNKEMYQLGSNNPFNVFLNPAFVNKYKPDPVSKMVLDIWESTGETIHFPRVAQAKIKLGSQTKEPIELSPGQYTEFQKYIGNKTDILFTILADNPKFMAKSDDEKAKVLQGYLTDINTAAKAEILGYRPAKVSQGVITIIRDIGRNKRSIDKNNEVGFVEDEDIGFIPGE